MKRRRYKGASAGVKEWPFCWAETKYIEAIDPCSFPYFCSCLCSCPCYCPCYCPCSCLSFWPCFYPSSCPCSCLSSRSCFLAHLVNYWLWICVQVLTHSFQSWFLQPPWTNGITGLVSLSSLLTWPSTESQAGVPPGWPVPSTAHIYHQTQGLRPGVGQTSPHKNL